MGSNPPSIRAAPDRRWAFLEERKPISLSFNPDCMTKCKLVGKSAQDGQIRDDTEHPQIMWNVASYLMMDQLHATQKEGMTKIDLRREQQDSHHYITAMDYTSEALDGYAILVGFSSGEVQILTDPRLRETSMQVQRVNLGTNSTNSKEKCPCIEVAWVPGSQGSEFVTGLMDGSILLHKKLIANSSDTELLHRSESTSSFRADSAVLVRSSSDGPIYCMSLSPDGSRIAVGTKDGRLQVLDIHTGALHGGFHSFFGGVLCCTWSPDGRMIAAGGEDDLIAVWDVETRQLSCHCEGHTSWVSSIAFDSSVRKEEDAPRLLASVGQDCKVCMWEIIQDSFENTESPNQSKASLPPRHPAISDGLTLATKKNDMNLINPLCCLRVHHDPLSYVGFLHDSVVVGGYDGAILVWKKLE